MGRIMAVNISEKKGTQKKNVHSAKIIEDWGLENDAHAGKWHRQVSLLSYEKIEDFKAKGAPVDEGAFGENLIVQGIDLRQLPVGTQLQCGEVLLEVTQIGKKCHSGCEIFKIMGDGKSWSEGVDEENGNYDYLMFANLDFNHPEVVKEMERWGIWVSRELDLDGMRLDAIKHINDEFIRKFLAAVRKERGADFYAVGEYWKQDLESLDDYLKEERYKVDLFDVPLHYNMYQASKQGRDYDLSKILDGTLVQNHPTLAVTFVDNHDSQWGSSLESAVEDWFKPSAYALILLMKEGYPCIFYGDYYGVSGNPPMHRAIIDNLLEIRKNHAFGEQNYYFDHPNTIGFTRVGDEEHPHSGVAVLISNGEDGDKVMNVGKQHAGETWKEATGNVEETVSIDGEGNGRFLVHGGNVAVWIPENALQDARKEDGK